MKNITLIILCFAFLLTSCTKEEPKNDTAANSSTVNVKYEIIASSNIRNANGVNNPNITFTFTNSLGQQQIETNSYPADFRSWTKTFTLTNTNRPLNLRVQMSQTPQANYFVIQNGGTVKLNIYLDGILTQANTEISTSSYLLIGPNLANSIKWYQLYSPIIKYTIQ